MIKIVSIVGARPQFVKVGVVSRAIAAYNKVANSSSRFRHIIIHTGQHYDRMMSEVFFNQLDIPQPNYNLGVGSASHGVQTGKMLMGIEKVLLNEKPRLILTYGDTNSALAGALAAVKIRIPIAHIEAGLRSYNRVMPEEINRILLDHMSDLCFCPTARALRILNKEGRIKNVYNTGDVMREAVKYYIGIAVKKSNILVDLDVRPKKYYLVTIHRPSNVDNKKNISLFMGTLAKLDLPVVFPLHPRIKKILSWAVSRHFKSRVMMVEPLSYFDMLVLEKNARLILTDSGGVQKEAYCLGVPCITLRNETEWVETVEEGWNIIAGTNKQTILVKAVNFRPAGRRREIFGRGSAGRKMVEIMKRFLIVK